MNMDEGARGATATSGGTEPLARRDRKRRALEFVLLVGAMSFFADFVYEGARGIAGPFLALLGASGVVVGAASGLGELAGYGLRLVSGRLADRTRAYWPITITGYIVQMAAVPALALAGSWQAAAGLLVLERVGKATRNPPRDVMLSHAGKEMGGYGWAFGLHEALDQCGALLGPLVMAAVLAWRQDFRPAFAVLGVPAICTLLLLLVARFLYPRTEEFEPSARTNLARSHFPRVFWIYLAGAGLVAAGFADFPLIAFHFQRASVVPQDWIPVFYAVAMGVGGAGSLAFGRLFDRSGLKILVPLTLASALYAPLAFLTGRWTALGGMALWGLGVGVHESILAAAIATMVPTERRATAYGVFTAAFGAFWFLGSVLLGWLYDASLPAMVGAAVALEVGAVPLFILAARGRA
ncbi:MAG TPA: MFS transporter [Anaeromyxobacteraceae bacterium]|nr:MFS transporter [Anaeromyxobacteraceae bacterium]